MVYLVIFNVLEQNFKSGLSFQTIENVLLKDQADIIICSIDFSRKGSNSLGWMLKLTHALTSAELSHKSHNLAQCSDLNRN